MSIYFGAISFGSKSVLAVSYKAFWGVKDLNVELDSEYFFLKSRC